MTVSYLEWVQGKQGYYWSEKEVNEKLQEMMERATNIIWEKAVKNQSQNSQNQLIPNLKKAAFEVAIERIIVASD